MVQRGQRDATIEATPVTLGDTAAASSGVFAVRKPPAQGCLSTLEAVARALDELEPPAHGEPPLSHALLRPMLRVVELQSALQRRTTHRPDRPGYRPRLAEEVAGAIRALRLDHGQAHVAEDGDDLLSVADGDAAASEHRYSPRLPPD